MTFFFLASASYHQGAECLPAEARGRQCVTCCIMFLFTLKFLKPPGALNTIDLNNILQSGSQLYCAMLEKQLIVGNFVHPEEVPNRIFYENQRVSVIHKGVVSGTMGTSPVQNIASLQSLESAFLNSYTLSHYFILIFCEAAVGIHYDGTHFFVFDSHSRNKNGSIAVEGEGTAVLGILHSLGDLCSYLRSLVTSFKKDLCKVQFDLHIFNLIKKSIGSEYAIEILHPRFDFKFICTDRKRALVTENRCDNNSPVLVEESKVIANFHRLVSVGPDYVCSSCTQTFFKHHVRNAFNLSKDTRQQFLSDEHSVNGMKWVCVTCWKMLKQGRTPKFWIHNGLKFPDKPIELQLSSLEERLVSPRLPFMQLREMPRGGQLNLRGNVVNVPADISSTIRSLPRLLNEDETIMLKLKRRLDYKHHVAFENIRPNKVYEAAKWLVSNSALFKSEGIVINETWLQQPQEAFCKEDDQEQTTNERNTESDCWTEDENFNDRPTGNTDTCLQPVDFREFNKILCLAPGEHSSPLGLFQDTHSEILSFPSVFCGQPRADNSKRQVALHYSDICKWELRNVDRRVALCLPNIFYKLKKLQIKQIKDKVSLAVRKCKTKSQSLTAGNLLTPGFVEKLTMQDDGYRVLRTLRGSPPYWEQAKRDLFSMIRQIGLPTWFCSFSAAETKWEPLLKTLSNLVDHNNIDLNAASGLSWQEKCRLIKSDPVTCARYFDYRVQVFFREVLKHVSNPVGKIEDFFYRVEFQQRGSPHIHMLAWIENAPVHGRDSDLTIASFIDKYVTCIKDTGIPDLINYQTHRHANTCKKQGKNICRFNFPLFPMPETTILYPLEANENCPDFSEKVEKVTAVLNELHKNDVDITFQDFLVKIDMDFHLYVKVVRSTLTRAKVFLKRSVSESRINNYNSVLLKSWQANMDIQYVMDAYSCVSYIVSYISKGQRGLSNLLRDACHEAEQQHADIKQRVRKIGNQFLTSVEIGAQEAVYLVLQMPLRRCTRDVIYVDTKQPNERTSLIKSQTLLKELPSSSCDVEMDSILKRYKRRPKIMDNLCYADFATWYDLCPGRKKLTNIPQIEDLPEIDYEHDKEDELEPCGSEFYESTVTFPCGTRVRKRSRQKVMYTHITSINHDREDHFRQKLMLYTPWRDEVKDLLNVYSTYEQSFYAQKNELVLRQKQYEKSSVDDYISMIDGSDDNRTAVVNSESEFQEAVDTSTGMCNSSEFECFDPSRESNIPLDYDIGEDIGIQQRSQGSEVLPLKEVGNDEYLQQVRSLNHEQKQFFYYMLGKVKKHSLPFYTFLSGGAGVGKSVVTRCIYQGLLKYLNHKRNVNPDSFQIMLCAPTGKAAHNIGGSTIHSAFCIPANQGFQFKPLDMQQLNSMRARYHSLKMVIIDEISMVGRGMFNYINLRLQEIMGISRPFGNVSILAVGDLYQLKPVMDAWIFSQKFSSPQIACLAPNLWIEHFDFFELKVIMRQKDDQSFAELLNRLREGLYTENDLVQLQSRQVESSEHPSLQALPHLFCRRQDSFAHNFSVLQNHPSADIIVVKAVDDVSGDVGSNMRNTILDKLPDDPSQCMGLQKELTLGIGLPAEICCNIDTADGITNGASCKIQQFDFRVPGSNRCSIIWVEFEDKTVGKNWRLQYKHLYRDSIPTVWTPVLETRRMFTFRYFKTYLVTRRQFPLCLSAAKTIHKAQGSTMKAAVLHFGKRKIEHIHYVGLSRVTSLSHIHITELNMSKIAVSEEVEEEMARLRQNKYISCIPSINSLHEAGVIKLCFHNCRSLNKHFQDFKQDVNMLCADIIGLAEARVWGAVDQNFPLEGFKMKVADKEHAKHGLVIYYRASLGVHIISSRTVSCIEYILVGLNHNTVIGFVYCPPRQASVASITQFLIAVSNDVTQYKMHNNLCKLVLMGDFNFECCSKHENLIRLFSDMCQLNQLLKTETTDYDSCIDHIYSSLCQSEIIDFGTLESYYSDHKAIYLAFSIH